MKTLKDAIDEGIRSAVANEENAAVVWEDKDRGYEWYSVTEIEEFPEGEVPDLVFEIRCDDNVIDTVQAALRSFGNELTERNGR